MKRGKKYKKMADEFENKEYSQEEAIKVAKKMSYSEFPGTLSIHLAVKLPKDKEPKSVKGSISLPHPVKQEDLKIIVFCDEKEAEKAKKAGASEAGLEKLIKKVQDGFSDFDIVLATPQVMGQIAVLGRDLGPKGLMPSPKTGTLVEDVEKAVEEFKKGKTQFICDESSVIHIPVGKVDTNDKEVIANIKKSIEEVAKVIGKPTTNLFKSIFISPTMGPGVKVKIDSAV